VSRMFRSVASKVAWVGRTASMVFGLVLVLALVLGAATMALAAVPGDPFKLGKVNRINDALTALIGSHSGAMMAIDNNSTATSARALDLRVEQRRVPMTVNSDRKVANLNADKIDGLDSTEIGVSGVETTFADSVENSDSYKIATATCPEGKVSVGSGYVLIGGKRGTFPNLQTDVVITYIIPTFEGVQVAAYEEEPTSAEWMVRAVARCAKGYLEP
jgi:hypothetical protein